jgi:DNA phosphorothioation-associated putative methyltransferase
LHQATQNPKVDRHKAAIVRSGLSRPVRLAFEAGLLGNKESFFDYGCGHGIDVKILADKGYPSSGWDPYYFPDERRRFADVVNLGYVINVIEHEHERREALLSAWELARTVLIVAAQVLVGEPGKGNLAFNDGLITSRNTFQRYYEQHELKTYIDSVLGTDAVPVSLGVFFVFRDETQAQSFRASRFRSHTATPRVRAYLKSFEEYRGLLSPLMQFVSDRGRLPAKGELANESHVINEFRSILRAFNVIKRATDQGEWENLIQRRRQDLLVYIALSRFDRRPRFTDLPFSIQQDIKSFFGNYSQACKDADQLLFSLGQPDVIQTACVTSHIGKLVGNTLYVHISALDKLSAPLRLYEGCASRTFGKLDEVTIIKFRTDKPVISYLYYPDFDTDPHPVLRSSMQANLRGLYVGYRDYAESLNPPILHRKETFVAPDYPHYHKFAKFTEQEERWGLLDNPVSIGNKNGWAERLRACNVAVQGHRLIRMRSEDSVDR